MEGGFQKFGRCLSVSEQELVFFLASSPPIRVGIQRMQFYVTAGLINCGQWSKREGLFSSPSFSFPLQCVSSIATLTPQWTDSENWGCRKLTLKPRQIMAFYWCSALIHPGVRPVPVLWLGCAARGRMSGRALQLMFIWCKCRFLAFLSG